MQSVVAPQPPNSIVVLSDYLKMIKATPPKFESQSSVQGVTHIMSIEVDGLVHTASVVTPFAKVARPLLAEQLLFKLVPDKTLEEIAQMTKVVHNPTIMPKIIEGCEIPDDNDPVVMLYVLCKKRGATPPILTKQAGSEDKWELNLNVNGETYHSVVSNNDKVSAGHEACEDVLLQVFPDCKSIPELRKKIECESLKRTYSQAELDCIAVGNSPPTTVTALVPGTTSNDPRYAMTDAVSVFTLFAQAIKMNIPPINLTSPSNAKPVTAQVTCTLPDGTRYTAAGQGHDKREAKNDAAMHLLFMIHPQLPDFDAVKKHVKELLDCALAAKARFANRGVNRYSARARFGRRMFPGPPMY